MLPVWEPGQGQKPAKEMVRKVVEGRSIPPHRSHIGRNFKKVRVSIIPGTRR